MKRIDNKTVQVSELDITILKTVIEKHFENNTNSAEFNYCLGLIVKELLVTI